MLDICAMIDYFFELLDCFVVVLFLWTSGMLFPNLWWCDFVDRKYSVRSLLCFLRKHLHSLIC